MFHLKHVNSQDTPLKPEQAGSFNEIILVHYYTVAVTYWTIVSVHDVILERLLDSLFVCIC